MKTCQIVLCLIVAVNLIDASSTSCRIKCFFECMFVADPCVTADCPCPEETSTEAITNATANETIPVTEPTVFTSTAATVTNASRFSAPSFPSFIPSFKPDDANSTSSKQSTFISKLVDAVIAQANSTTTTESTTDVNSTAAPIDSEATMSELSVTDSNVTSAEVNVTEVSSSSIAPLDVTEVATDVTNGITEVGKITTNNVTESVVTVVTESSINSSSEFATIEGNSTQKLTNENTTTVTSPSNLNTNVSTESSKVNILNTTVISEIVTDNGSNLTDNKTVESSNGVELIADPSNATVENLQPTTVTAGSITIDNETAMKNDGTELSGNVTDSTSSINNTVNETSSSSTVTKPDVVSNTTNSTTNSTTNGAAETVDYTQNSTSGGMEANKNVTQGNSEANNTISKADLTQDSTTSIINDNASTVTDSPLTENIDLVSKNVELETITATDGMNSTEVNTTTNTGVSMNATSI